MFGMERVTHRQHLGPRFSEGSRQMWLRMSKLDMTPADFSRAAAKATGSAWPLSKTFRYLWGDRCPDRGPAGTISKILGVEMGDFDRKPVRAFTPPAARAA